MHLGIALALSILGRVRRLDDRRIDQRAFLEQQAAFGQGGVDRLKDPPRQPIALEQAAELEQRGRIRGVLAAQINAHKPADPLAVVDRILGPLVRQPETLLRNVQAQHPLQPDRRATPLTALGIVRFERLCQGRPRYDLFQVVEEPTRRVRFFLAAYSRYEKLDCMAIIPVCSDEPLSQTQTHHRGRKRINQRLQRLSHPHKHHPLCFSLSQSNQIRNQTFSCLQNKAKKAETR
jgi:hypothetical protein